MEQSGDDSSEPGASGGPDTESHGAEDGHTTPGEDASAVSRTTLVTGIVMVLVLVVVVGVLIATSGGDDGGDGLDLPATAVLGTTDGFERVGPEELGALTSDRDWRPFAGVWGIDNGDARVVLSAEARSHAVIGLGDGDGAVQVRVERVTSGAGIDFRFQGLFNYWAVVAAPSVGTWNLLRVEKGESTVVGNTGPTSVADGTTVAAWFEGDRIAVVVNGAVVLTVQDDFLSDQGKVGLTVRGEDDTEARFDDFVAALAGNRPLFIRGESVGAAGSSTPPSTESADGNSRD